MTQAERIESEALPDLPGDELAPGTQLSNGAYTIVEHLKSGGFGITYLANDTLGRRVVIKECFPGGMCVRQTRMVRVRSQAHRSNVSNLIERFVAEAHSMAKITHPNVVRVHQVFKENNTAYMALDYVDGQDLLDIMQDPSLALSPAGVRSMLLKLLDAVGTVHDAGVLHRDISPDNIVLDSKRNPILIDFGAARERERPTERPNSTLHVVKDGYSPQELYLSTGGDQGPWSDLYSLGATFYHLITGQAPENSQARLAALASNTPDPCVPLVGRFPAYGESFLGSIDKAMAVLPKERLQSARKWTAAISETSKTAVTSPPEAPTTRPVTPMTRVTRMEAQAARKNTRPAMLVGGLAALAVVAVGVFLAMPDKKTATVDGAAADFAAASPKASVAQGVVAPATAAVEPAPAAAPATAAVAPAAQPEAAAASTETVVRSEMSALTTNWTVEVPFAANRDTPTTVATTAGQVPDWLVPGLQIVAVNGTSIGSLAEIPAILHEAQTPADAPAITTTLSTVGTAGAADQVIDLPVVHRVVLVSGAEFLVRWVDGVWRTEVAILPESYGGEMRVGDVILGHVSSNTRMDSPTALKEALESDIIAGNRSTKLAIQQGGQMWVVTFTLPG